MGFYVEKPSMLGILVYDLAVIEATATGDNLLVNAPLEFKKRWPRVPSNRFIEIANGPARHVSRAEHDCLLSM